MLLFDNIDIPVDMMTDLISLTPRQKLVLAAVEELATKREMNEEVTYRNLSNKHNISMSSLCSFAPIGHTPHAVIEANDVIGRKHRFTIDKKRFIVATILEFHRNVTPLYIGCTLDLTQTLISSFSASRQNTLGFVNGRPGKDWLRSFTKRHRALAIRRRVVLENDRAEAMTPQNVAMHFATLTALMDKFEINDPSRIFILDKS